MGIAGRGKGNLVIDGRVEEKDLGGKGGERGWGGVWVSRGGRRREIKGGEGGNGGAKPGWWRCCKVGGSEAENREEGRVVKGAGRGEIVKESFLFQILEGRIEGLFKEYFWGEEGLRQVYRRSKVSVEVGAQSLLDCGIVDTI